MAVSLEERLTELEVRFAFLEDTVGVLNHSVVEHDRLIGLMRTEFERMRQELGAVRTALAPDARDEPPPPHY